MSLNCWTLWQRMPPRYQLTMRDVRQEDEATPGRSSSPTQPSRPSSSAGPKSPRLRSPRGAQRVGSARARLSGDGAMLRSGVLPEDYAKNVEYGPQSPVLPARRSPYIHNMKNQMRLNSARRKMDESGMMSPIPKSYTPKPRATTAPPFPITKLSNHPQDVTSLRYEHHDLEHNGSTSKSSRMSKQLRGFTGMRSPKRPSSGYALQHVLDPRRVSVHTISPFGELTAEGSNPVLHERSPRQQDCVIGDYQVAALYLDKGRVTFFRKTRPDVAQSVYSAMNPFMTTRDDGSYLAHLRKAYLSGVRDLPKITTRQPDMEKHITIKERMDYDRKVGRILDYYAKVDIPKEVHAPRSPNAQYIDGASAPQRGFRTMISRRRAPTSTEISSVISVQDGGKVDPALPCPRLHPYHHNPDQQQPFHMRDASGFVRINARARLHDRHFYLRTPAGVEVAGEPTQIQDMSDCACGMCRLEMEVALMAQLQREMGVSIEAFTSPRSVVQNTQARNMPNNRQKPLGAVSEEDGCPARPNSVSDARKDAKTQTPEGQPPTQSGWRGHEAQRPPTEPTSLKVTLPGVHEASEGAGGASSTDRDGLGDTVRSEEAEAADSRSQDQDSEQAKERESTGKKIVSPSAVFTSAESVDVKTNDGETNTEGVESSDSKTKYVPVDEGNVSSNADVNAPPGEENKSPQDATNTSYEDTEKQSADTGEQSTVAENPSDTAENSFEHSAEPPLTSDDKDKSKENPSETSKPIDIDPSAADITGS